MLLQTGHMAGSKLIFQLNASFYTVEVVHGSLGDQEVQAVLLPTNAKLIPSGPMAHCFSLVLGKPGAKRAYSEAAKVVLDRRKWGGTFPAGNVAMFPDIATDPLHRTIFCTNTAHLQGGAPSELTSLDRTLSTALDMIIFGTDMESLALPFIGSGKPYAVNVAAPVLINLTTTFLRIPHAPQSLKVMKIVDGDLRRCHVLAAAMQQSWPDLIAYMDETARQMAPVTHTAIMPGSQPTYINLLRSSTSQASDAAIAVVSGRLIVRNAIQELAMSIKRGMLLPQDNDSAGDHDDGGFQPPEPSTENAGNSVAQALHEEQAGTSPPAAPLAKGECWTRRNVLFSNAAQTAPSTLPSSALQTAQPGILPSSTSETAASDTLPYMVPKTAESLIGRTPAAKSTAHIVTAESLLNDATQTGALITQSGSGAPAAASGTIHSSTKTADSSTLPKLTFPTAGSGPLTSVLQIAGQGMLPGTAANTNTVPGRAPQTAEASKLPGSILHTTELGATHAALHFEQTPLLSSTVDINDHLIQATTPSSSDWLISSVNAHAQADTALVKLDLRVVPDPSDTVFVTITPLGCPGIQLDDWVRLDLKVTSDPCDHVSVTISPATPGNQINDLVTLDITIPSDTVFITLTPLPRGKQVISSQLLSKGKHVEKMHDSTSDAAVGGDHKVETLGPEKNACRAHKSRRQGQSSQKLHSVETGAVVTCIKTDSQGGWIDERGARSDWRPDQATGRIGKRRRRKGTRRGRHVNNNNAAAAEAVQSPGLPPPGSIQAGTIDRWGDEATPGNCFDLIKSIGSKYEGKQAGNKKAAGAQRMGGTKRGNQEAATADFMRKFELPPRGGHKERAATSFADILKANAAKEKQEEKDMQQLEQRGNHRHPSPPPIYESGGVWEASDNQGESCLRDEQLQSSHGWSKKQTRLGGVGRGAMPKQASRGDEQCDLGWGSQQGDANGGWGDDTGAASNSWGRDPAHDHRKHDGRKAGSKVAATTDATRKGRNVSDKEAAVAEYMRGLELPPPGSHKTKAAAAAARNKQENAAKETKEELELQQLEQRRNGIYQTPASTHASGPAPPLSTQQTSEVKRYQQCEAVWSEPSTQHEQAAPRKHSLPYQQNSKNTRDQSTQTPPVRIEAHAPTPQDVFDMDAWLLETDWFSVQQKQATPAGFSRPHNPGGRYQPPQLRTSPQNNELCARPPADDNDLAHARCKRRAPPPGFPVAGF